MDPVDTQRIAPEVLRAPARQAPLPLPQARLCSRCALAATILTALVWLGAVLAGRGTGPVGCWSAGLVFLFAVVTMLACLGHRLPLQNLCAVLLVSWASAVLGLTLAVKSGVLFGAIVYADGFGPRMLGIVPWQLPFLWLALVLSSRETARLILRPWRRDRQYGYWLLGVAALLVLCADLALQPFAVRAAGWWLFEGATPAVNWLGVPWVVLLTGIFLTLTILLFTSPWLVAKRAVPTPRDYCSLAIWLLLVLCFLIGNAARGLWLPVLVSLGGMTAAILLTWRARAALPPMTDDSAKA